MYLITSFNQTMDYFETVLGGEIEAEKVAQISGYSYPMFSRLFSILTEMTLSEYLRSRRLTEAAIALRDSEAKVIDIALSFGYESSDSFGAAFKSFHGFTPSEVRNGKAFKVVSRMQLALSVKGGRSMKITMQKKEAFTVAGRNEENINTSLCPAVWDKLCEKYGREVQRALREGRCVGVCHDVKNPGAINYLAGFMVTDASSAKAEGLDILEMGEAEYAVVELEGSVPECIHQGWKYAMEVFFPEHGYVHSGSPDFEYYYEGDMHSPEYRMELWIPVVKAELKQES